MHINKLVFMHICLLASIRLVITEQLNTNHFWNDIPKTEFYKACNCKMEACCLKSMFSAAVLYVHRANCLGIITACTRDNFKEIDLDIQIGGLQRDQLYHFEQ